MMMMIMMNVKFDKENTTNTHIPTLFELIRVKPTMSAKRILTLSMPFMLKGRNIDVMSLAVRWRGDTCCRASR